jgi:plastocyanin
VACGGEIAPADDAAVRQGASARAEVPPDSSTSGYVVVDDVDGGTIRGVVRFVGDVPEGRLVPVTEDTAACGTERVVQSVRVGREGGLANAVVSLVDIKRGGAQPDTSSPALDQSGCTFAPHVLLAQAGATVRVLNSDPLTHNVHTAAFDNRSVNRSQPAGADVIELTFDAPEKVRVKCDLHPWMGAWIVVVEHPYHVVTDESGTFELSDVPAGSYTMETWHETLGTTRQEVTVLPGATHELTVDLAGGN